MIAIKNETNMFACLMSKPIKIMVFPCCLSILIICYAKLAVGAMPKAEIPYTLYATLQYPCVSDTLHILTYFFFGKPVWTLESECYDPGRKIWIQPFTTWSDSFSHSEITYAIAHLESCLYVYMFSIFVRFT